MIHDFDSIIFDMDGTLWDAVDSYCQIWNKTFVQMNIKASEVSRTQLLECMGMPINDIFRRIVDVNIDEDKFLKLLDVNEKEMMPKLGGILYPGVNDTIQMLASTHRLFMVSNCGAEGLHNFLEYTCLKPYFEGTLTYGETFKSKADNIKSVISTYKLKSPVYVGDTQSDCNSAHVAGIPMIFASYGFGECSDAEYTINKFSELIS